MHTSSRFALSLVFAAVTAMFAVPASSRRAPGVAPGEVRDFPVYISADFDPANFSVAPGIATPRLYDVDVSWLPPQRFIKSDGRTVDYGRFRGWLTYMKNLQDSLGVKDPLICLDIEGEFWRVAQQRDEQLLQAMIDAVQFAKSEWPEARYSVWGIPEVRWPDSIEFTKPLLEVVDWYAPVMYDLPERGSYAEIMEQFRRTHPDKPCLAWLTHRVRTENWRLWTLDEVRTHLRPALRHCDGMIWYHEERWELENHWHWWPQHRGADPEDPGFPRSRGERVRAIERYINLCITVATPPADERGTSD